MNDDYPDLEDLIVPILGYRTVQTIYRYGTAEEIAILHRWLNEVASSDGCPGKLAGDDEGADDGEGVRRGGVAE